MCYLLIMLRPSFDWMVLLGVDLGVGLCVLCFVDLLWIVVGVDCAARFLCCAERFR